MQGPKTPHSLDPKILQWELGKGLGERLHSLQVTDPSQGPHRGMNRERLRQAGFQDGEIDRLVNLKVNLKRHVASGQRTELTWAHKYLLSLKYLRESDRLDEEQAT